MLMPQRYTDAVRAVEQVRQNLSWERTAEIMVEAYRSAGSRRSQATAR